MLRSWWRVRSTQRNSPGLRPRARSTGGRGIVLLAAATLQAGAGCMALSTQLPPTDYAALEQVEDRDTRETLYAENTIYVHREPQGLRYTKGSSTSATKRSWQSLDAVLRSDANSSAALPTRQLRLSRLFTALTVIAGIVTVAGTAASAREGLNLGDLNGTGALMLGGGLATVGFGITAGVFYGKAKRGYQEAVHVYNDSLGMRLGILTPKGDYIAPKGALVDEEGRVMLELPEAAPKPKPKPEPEPEPPDLSAPTEPEGPAPSPEEAAEPEADQGDLPDEEEAAPEAAPAEPPAEPIVPESPGEPQPQPSEPEQPEIQRPSPPPGGRLGLRPRTSARL